MHIEDGGLVGGWEQRTYNRMKKKRGGSVEENLCVRWTLGRELERIGGVRSLPGGGLVIFFPTSTDNCYATPQQIVRFVRNNIYPEIAYGYYLTVGFGKMPFQGGELVVVESTRLGLHRSLTVQNGYADGKQS